MLKILLKLWWIQKQRTFDWKRMGIFIYMVLCIIVGMGAGYWQAGGELGKLFTRGGMEIIIVPLVMMFSPMELLMKFLLPEWTTICAPNPYHKPRGIAFSLCSISSTTSIGSFQLWPSSSLVCSCL